MKEKPELGEDNSGCHTGAGSSRLTGNTEVKLKMELPTPTLPTTLNVQQHHRTRSKSGVRH
jgi:hypothetical protein